METPGGGEAREASLIPLQEDGVSRIHLQPDRWLSLWALGKKGLPSRSQCELPVCVMGRGKGHL